MPVLTLVNSNLPLASTNFYVTPVIHSTNYQWADMNPISPEKNLSSLKSKSWNLVNNSTILFYFLFKILMNY